MRLEESSRPKIPITILCQLGAFQQDLQPMQNNSRSGYTITRDGRLVSSHSPTSMGTSEGSRLTFLDNCFRQMKSVEKRKGVC